MAPMLGPDENSRDVWLAPGVSAHGRTATFYTNAAATSLATILTYDGTGTPGSAVSGSALTIDANSQIPLTWFPDGSDVLYVRVNGMSGIKKVNADFDARLDVVAGWVQAVPVADQAALTASAPAALTSAALTGGESPTEAEHNALQADVAALRTTLAAVVADAVVARAKTNALLASLRTSQVLDT